jgi:hypothetical protein
MDAEERVKEHSSSSLQSGLGLRWRLLSKELEARVTLSAFNYSHFLKGGREGKCFVMEKQRKKKKKGKNTNLISTLLHLHLPLHLGHLLLLCKSQCPRHTEQENTGTDDPESFAAVVEGGLDPGRGCGDRVGEVLAVGGGNNVFEG